MGRAADLWADALASWAIPQEIVDAAPESPWYFPPVLFARRTESLLRDPARSPALRRAAEALPPGGTVLDVGAGAGAASLPLAPPAASVVAVDQGAELLAEFAALARGRGVEHRAVQGRWPDVAGEVDPADVVVCSHVFYNVAHLAPFAAALTSHARRRVVVDLTTTHPLSNLSPLWKAVHGIDRPTSPTAHDAVAVLAELGLDVQVDEHQEPFQHDDGDDRALRVARTRRRLCVGPERDAEIGELLDALPAQTSRPVVTIWWPGEAPGGD